MYFAASQRYRIAVRTVVVPGAWHKRWCASARISGVSDGAPFTMVLDLYAQAFETEAEAIRYGSIKAEARLQQMIERRALP